MLSETGNCKYKIIGRGFLNTFLGAVVPVLQIYVICNGAFQ